MTRTRPDDALQRPSASAGSLGVVFLTVFVDLLGFGMVLPLLPVYGRELMTDYGAVEKAWILGLLMTCYSIAQLLFAPLWGRVSDHVGRRPILLLSLASSTCFYALFGLATMWGSLGWMFLSRIGGGIAGATIPTAQAYIADVTPRQQRTRGMALIGVAFGLGFTFGPLLGALALLNAATAHLSPWPGFVAALLSAAALALAVFRLAESIDWQAERSEPNWFTLGALRDALAVPSIVLLLATLFLSSFGFAAFEGTLSLVLADFLGLERGGYQILLAYAYIGFVQTLVQGGLVRWLARFTPDGVLAVSGAAIAVGGYLLLAVGSHPQTGGPLMSMVAASIIVSGLGFIYPAVNALISRRSDPAKQGGILGLGASLGSLARIGGVVVAMRLRAWEATLPFWLAAALMVLGTGAVFVGVRRGRDWPG